MGGHMLGDIESDMTWYVMRLTWRFTVLSKVNKVVTGLDIDFSLLGKDYILIPGPHPLASIIPLLGELRVDILLSSQSTLFVTLTGHDSGYASK